jgi:hypothetical protein
MEVFKKELDLMLKDDVVEPSMSDWQGAWVIVQKPKDPGKWRIAQDFRILNERTVIERYPLPRIDQAIEELSGCKYFTCMDIKSAFWQIRLGNPDDSKERQEKVKDYTAFGSPWGQFRWKRMPMGLHSSPSTWQKCVN